MVPLTTAFIVPFVYCINLRPQLHFLSALVIRFCCRLYTVLSLSFFVRIEHRRLCVCVYTPLWCESFLALYWNGFFRRSHHAQTLEHFDIQFDHRQTFLKFFVVHGTYNLLGYWTCWCNLLYLFGLDFLSCVFIKIAIDIRYVNIQCNEQRSQKDALLLGLSTRLIRAFVETFLLLNEARPWFKLIC